MAPDPTDTFAAVRTGMIDDVLFAMTMCRTARCAMFWYRMYRVLTWVDRLSWERRVTCTRCGLFSAVEDVSTYTYTCRVCRHKFSERSRHEHNRHA